MAKTSNLVLLSERGQRDPGIVTLYDKSRYANNGVLTAVTTQRQPSGVYAHVFNGTTSLITIAAAKSLSPYNKNGYWSASAWIKPTTDGKNDLGTILRQASGWFFRVRNEAAGTVRLNGFVDHVTTDAEVVSSTTMTCSVWHHVAMVYNRLGTLKIELYIDGAECALSTDTAGVGALTNGSANALILGNDVAVSNTFDGSIAWWKVAAEAWSAGKNLNDYEAEKVWWGR